MDAVLSAFVIYAFMLVALRIAGRRTLGEMTAFDFVVILVIGESTQQALLGDDFSLTNAMIVIATLIGIDIALSVVKSRWPAVAKVVDGMPMILVENGRPLRQRMRRARVDEDDVLEAAREKRGIERLDQIKYAILEVSGGVSIVPYPSGKRARKPAARRA